MRIAKSRKAVSTVIATILMINVALVTGVLAFAWAQGLFGSWASKSGAYFQSRGESMEENLVLVNIRFDSASYYKLNLTVRNIGERDAWIASVYLNNTDVTSQISWAWNNDGATVWAAGIGPHYGRYGLKPYDAITFAFRSITSPVFTKGNLLIVVVATERGTHALEQWKVAG